jgi:hypothetical protein
MISIKIQEQKSVSNQTQEKNKGNSTPLLGKTKKNNN